MTKAWESRIVGHDMVDPDELTAHPLNHRLHPEKQREIVRDSIADLGVLKSFVVNKKTGFLVDGHERLRQAIEHKKKNPDLRIPVEYVELSESEEAAAIAILDASGEEREIDAEKLDELLREFNTESQSIADMLTELAESSGAIGLGDESEPEDFSGDSFDEIFEIKITCESESHQQQVYEMLSEKGIECKVMVIN